MACKSCGAKQTAQPRSFEEGNTMQDLFDSGKYKLVRYEGRDFTTTIGSPTGAIVKDGLKNYGRAKSGDFLLVHIDDIQKTPQTFIILEKGSEAYQLALRKFGLTEAVPVQSVRSVQKEKVVEKSKIEAVVEEEEKEQKTVEKKQTEELLSDTSDAGGKLLSKSEALPLTDFRDAYGFSHHMQVMAKVRSGELKSYKTENDENMIYHYDEE